MPVKRRAGKARAAKITPEVVAHFVTARDTAETYLSCIRGEGCRSTEADRHCETCRAYLDASRELHSALGLRPWQPTVLHVRDGEDAEVEELRQRLDEAVRVAG